MSQLAKAGVAAGVSQLRETDIGALAQLVRMLNIASGAGLMACAGLMTLWECTMDLWLCNPDDENSRCVDLGIELCGEGADAPACILASEEVLAGVEFPDNIEAHPLDDVNLRGKARKIKLSGLRRLRDCDRAKNYAVTE